QCLNRAAELERDRVKWFQNQAKETTSPPRANRGEVAEALSHEGNFLDNIRRVSAALESFEKSLAIYDKLAAADAANVGYRHGRVGALMRLAFIHQRAGHADEGNRFVDQAVSIRQEAAKSGKPDDLRRLAWDYSGQGLIRMRTGHME